MKDDDLLWFIGDFFEQFPPGRQLTMVVHRRRVIKDDTIVNGLIEPLRKDDAPYIWCIGLKPLPTRDRAGHALPASLLRPLFRHCLHPLHPVRTRKARRWRPPSQTAMGSDFCTC